MRTKIADLTARMASLEAENEQLRAKMALISEQRRLVRRISIGTTERIARLERQLDEVSNDN